MKRAIILDFPDDFTFPEILGDECKNCPFDYEYEDDYAEICGGCTLIDRERSNGVRKPMDITCPLLEYELEGEWISVGDWILVCSNCDHEIEDPDTGEYPNYCPNCGTKMKSQIKKEVEE